jgi:diguanylate cyclase (GGDEF)-like protein
MDKSYRHSSRGHSDVLTALPIKTLWSLWYILVVIIGPFLVKTIVYQYYVLSVSFSLFITTATIYLCFLTKRKVPPFSVYIPIFLMSLSQSLGIYYTGIQAVFWAYPIIIVCYFVVSDRAANNIAVFQIILSGAFLYIQTDLPMVLRFIFSMVVVCILMRIMIKFVLSLKDELVMLSITDPLTHAYNRRYMDERLNASLVNRDAATLLIIDIDHFKQVNDTYGHDAGDAVLKRLVLCLQTNSRNDDLVFRMGGEEFVMLLSGTGKEQAGVYANFLREQLAKIAIDETERTITVSIGASELTDQVSLQDWLKQADICLYKAKSQGRDQVIVHC